MPLLALIVAAAVSYAAFAMTYAYAGRGISPYLGSALYLGVGAIASLVADIVVRAAKSERLLPTTSHGVLWSIVSGVLIGIFSVILVKIFARGGLAYVMPAVYGGTIVLTVVAARVLFRETISGLQLAGIAVIALGIAMVVYAKLAVPIR